MNCKNAASTKEVIIGTENGQLHEIAVDEKDKKEKYVKFLFELSELTEAFMGLQVLSLFLFIYLFLGDINVVICYLFLIPNKIFILSVSFFLCRWKLLPLWMELDIMLWLSLLHDFILLLDLDR